MAGEAASWAFEAEDAERVDRLLRSFLAESEARAALLVERTGQLIGSAGECAHLDLPAFASLAAADFSANDQLAAMLGEQEFSSLYHQGERESLYLVDVARRVILVVLFDQRATLGMIRIRVRGVVRELAALFEELFARSPARARVEGAWADAAEGEIDRLFGHG